MVEQLKNPTANERFHVALRSKQGKPKKKAYEKSRIDFAGSYSKPQKKRIKQAPKPKP